MSINRFFKDEVTIRRKTRVKVDYVMTEVIADIATIKVAIDPVTTSTVFVSDKETFTYTHKIFAPATADIQAGDVLVVITTVGETTKEAYYDVQPIIDPLNRHHHLEVLVNRRV